MAPTQPGYKQGYSKSTLSSHANRTAESDASFLLPHIKPTDKILDVGCGPGTITAGFAAYATQGSVLGTDISDAVLDRAREHVSSAGAAPGGSACEVFFQKADVLTGLPFPDGAFDVVYCSQLLPHLPPPDARLRALREMRRVLRPGGVFASRDAADVLWYPRRLRLDELFNARLHRAVGVPGWAGEDMPALLRAAGFDPDGGGKVRVGAGTTVFATPEERRWYAGGMAGRLNEGDPNRKSWAEAGFSDAEMKETQAALLEWADTQDAWYLGVHSEVLAWK